MDKKQKVTRVVIIFIALILFIFLIAQFIPIFKELLTEEGINDFKVAIQSLGSKGVLVLIGLMCSQILLPILPGEPVEVLAGMCFGPIKGMIVVLIGAFISTILIIVLIKVLGKKFIYTLISEEKVKKIENSKFFKDKKKIDILIFLLFFIPGTPKDILIYIAVLLPINITRFMFISIFARIPSVISSTLAGSSLVDENFVFSIGVYVVTFVITAIFIYFVNKKDKNILKAVDEIK